MKWARPCWASVSIIEPGAVATPIWEKSAQNAEAMLAAAHKDYADVWARAQGDGGRGSGR